MLTSWICTHFEKMYSFVEMFMLLNLTRDNQHATAYDTACHRQLRYVIDTNEFLAACS